MSFCPPDEKCKKCLRLVEFRKNNQQKFPSYHNAPVPSFGSLEAEILIVGLAPGLNGANQTGRPFTNDYAGDVLYPSLKKFGFAEGKSIMLKVQAKKNTERSHTGIPEGHFATREEALDWLKSEIGVY